MPIGVVANANPTEVMPWHLCRAFRRAQAYFIQRNDYRNGEAQARALSTTSRKVWELELGMHRDSLEEFREFFEARSGPLEPFYFYDVNDTAGFAYDPTGASATGRFTVRFDGPLEQSIGRGTLQVVSVRLVELA